MNGIRLLCMAFFAAAWLASAAQSGPKVLLETTVGNIIIELSDATPRHRDNFIGLVESQFYDSLLFHRAIANFIIQSGDATSRHAEPGHYIGGAPSDSTVEAEIRLPQLFHRRGAVAMARRSDGAEGDLASDQTQFFIVWGKRQSTAALTAQQERLDTVAPGFTMTDEMTRTYRKTGGAPHLDGEYTVFGQVVGGLDVVERISQADTDDYDRPIHDIRILKASVLRP